MTGFLIVLKLEWEQSANAEDVGGQKLVLMIWVVAKLLGGRRERNE